MFEAFSFTENTKKLFKIGSSEEKSLWSLNGFWVISMFMVMMGHSFSTSIAAPISNPNSLIDVLDTPLFPIVGTATFAVDSFFFLSGFLTFYLLTVKMYPTQGKTNFLLLYLHRYLWLLPILFFVFLFGMFIFEQIGNGTNFDWLWNILSSNCNWYWWSNFLYINNFIPWDMND